MLTRKFAHVDLTKKTVRILDMPKDWREKYLGSRGINMYLLYSLGDPSKDPLGPENPLTFGVGLLGGTPGMGSGRWQVSGVSPLCGNLGDSNGGGKFGAQLFAAGFGNLLITGKSPSPVYLHVTNDSIQIKDARHLWSKDTWDTQVALQKEHQDPRLESAVIGPAGEHMVRYANVMNGVKDSASGSGMGAVMGSKNLKAVAARGSKDVTVAHPDEYLAMCKEMIDGLMTRKWIRALGVLGTPLLTATHNEAGITRASREGGAAATEIQNLYPQKLLPYSVGMSACQGCTVHCRHRHVVKEGRWATRGEGPEAQGVGGMGTGLRNFNVEAMEYLADKCNRLGMTVGVGSLIAFAIRLYEKEIVSQNDTGRPLKWGDPELIEVMLEDIAHRRGFGDILADGPYGLKRLPAEAAQFMPLMKNHPTGESVLGNIRSFALANGVASLPAHNHRNMPNLDISQLPADFLEKLYGAGPMDSDPFSYTGKARMVYWHTAVNAICDALGFCRFQTVQNSPHGLKFGDYARLVSCALGWDMTEEKLWEIAIRTSTMERLFLIKFGVGSRKDDGPVPQWLKQEGRHRIDPTEYGKMLDQYYDLMGWGRNGHPPAEMVARLGIEPAKL